MGERSESPFLWKRYIRTANKHTNICSALLVIRKKQIKTTLKYHFTHSRMDIRKLIKRVAEDGLKSEQNLYTHDLYTACGNVSGIYSLENSLAVPPEG